MEGAPKDRDIKAINENADIQIIRWYAVNKYMSTWAFDISENGEKGSSFQIFQPVGWQLT